jgi:predicted ester cyclase
MSVDQTRKVMEQYAAAEHGDVTVLADDVVFRVMATGDEHRTPRGVKGMLDWFYHGAFDAHAELRHMVVGEGIAVLEADFVGRHIGEFAGVPPTGKEVRVPLAVVYDVRGDRIVEGRVYFETPAFLAQVGALG